MIRLDVDGEQSIVTGISVKLRVLATQHTEMVYLDEMSGEAREVVIEVHLIAQTIIAVAVKDGRK